MVRFVTQVVLASLFLSSTMWALSLTDSQETGQLLMSTSSRDQDEKYSLDLQLYEALKAGSVEDASRLLAMGASPDHHSSLRVAPLYYAAYYGHLGCVESLLDSGANWDVPNARWFTPHLIAYLEGHTKVAELFSARGSVLKDDDAHGWTPLHRAAFFGDDERVVALVPQGFLVDAVTIRGETPLHLAAQGGSSSCVNHLLTLKANLMARQKNGSTVLHCAAEGGILPLIGLCLEKDFNLLDADEKGWQPIHCAARYASSEAVMYLLQNGAYVNVKTIYGLAPVHLAAIHADVQSLRALVEWSAQLDVLSRNKRTPLHCAAQSNSVACAQFCLSKGINMEVEDVQGRRALEVAADNGSFKVLTTLLERGSRQKRTPPSLITHFFQPEYRSTLRLAVDGGHVACVRALLDSEGASYHEGFFKGTPLEAAMAYGSESVLREFVKRLHWLYDSPTQEKQESCLRVAEFLNVINTYKQVYPSLGGLNLNNMVKIITSLPETEKDFVRAILHMLRESERTVHLEEEKTVLRDNVPFLLSLDSTREAVKRASCEVLKDLFRQFHEKNTSEQYGSHDPLKRITDERRALLDTTQVKKNFGQTLRQGIDECITFLGDPTKASKGYMRTRYGYTPLHFAALRSSRECVQSLLERGLSVHGRTCEGLTPLHLAALGGKLENMHLLHEVGASMNAKTDRGTTVLQCAALGGTVSCVKFCLAADSTCDERNAEGWRALHFASYGGSASVINLLRSEGALMNEPSDMVSQWLGPSGRIASPLTLAIKRGHADCVKALLSGGVNPRQIDGSTEIPLEHILKYSSEDILHVFIKSMYRHFYPIHAKIEEARLALYTRFAQLHKSGSKLRVENVLPLLTDETQIDYFVWAILSELNTKVTYSSPAFDNFSSYQFKRMLETPKVVDIITTYVMKHLKILCKELCDTDELNKGQAGYICMSEKRRALLRPKMLDATFRSIVRVGIEERFAKLSQSLQGSLREDDSQENVPVAQKQKLLEALKNGLHHEVVRLLHKGISPNEKVAGRLTALSFAVYYGHKECVQTLIRAGADWESPFLYGCTPHKLAVLKNNVGTAELFSVRKSRVEPSDPSDWHTLHWASLFGDDTLVRALVSQGAPIDCRTDMGLTPLHLAALGGSQTCVNYLIEQGADRMAQQNSGWTLLHYAAEGNLTSLVDLCLKKELSIWVNSNDKGWQPIHCAADAGSSDVLKLLLFKESTQEKMLEMPLRLAIDGGHTECVKLLLDAGVDPMIGTLNEETPFECAMKYGSLSIVETFIHYSYKLLCPTDLEVGTSRICIDRALDTYRNQPLHKEPLTSSEKISYLTQSEIADEVARVILAFLNTCHTGNNNLARIAGLSAEETNSLLNMDETKDLVENYLVKQLSLRCEKLRSAHVNNTGDDNSQEMEPTRRELLSRESIKKVFGHKIRRVIEEQFACVLEEQFGCVLPVESEEASSSQGRRDVVVNLECCIF